MRRRKATAVPESRDTFVLRSAGSTRTSKYPVAALALIEAQMDALSAKSPTAILVERQPVLGGSSHPVYRVTRDESGAVTTIVLEED